MVVVAEVVRNSVVESRHHGSVIALDPHGDVVLSLGDPHAPMLPRSALKPLQAAGMVRAGLDVDDDLLALVCASHSGEAGHVAGVRRLLATAGLDEAALDNTPDLPLDPQARDDAIRAGHGPARITQNCSGKHAGMLASCVANGWPTDGYLAPEHALQRALREAVEDLTGEPVAATVVDGCGAPQFAVSLTGLARAFARLAVASPETAEGRCAHAMRDHPHLVGGSGRDVTALLAGVPGLVAKEGAEGVYVAATSDGAAVAVKIEDGAGRARLPVLVAALRQLGVAAPTLDDLAVVPVLGHGERVGEVRAVGMA
ncbi:MAG TPA: asparaginase [Mycobacteriales bacterium]|nr:asparaginase [Mycobacteriales bacterium]